MKEKVYLRITSGRGLAGCCQAVTSVLERMVRQAQASGLKVEMIEREVEPVSRALLSATIALQNVASGELVNERGGTAQWIARSLYHIYHKRRNRFVGMHSFVLSKSQEATGKDFRYETLRVFGLGGQYVNKTESAVRAVHIPSGVSVVASDQYSQWQNKKLTTEHLLVKLSSWTMGQAMVQVQENWSNHNHFRQGNPVKVIREPLV